MSSPLSARHKWCIEKVTQCFEGIINDAARIVLSFFSQSADVLSQLNEFFIGQGPDAIFVHYQTKQMHAMDVSRLWTHFIYS
jgi:hypothetical protein